MDVSGVIQDEGWSCVGELSELVGDFADVLSFFFFSSRRRHTRSDRDWSSDVCSSDLVLTVAPYHVRILARQPSRVRTWYGATVRTLPLKRPCPGLCASAAGFLWPGVSRSEERRVGKECRSRWSPYH